MDGYRQSSFDPDAGGPVEVATKPRWWKVLLTTLAYMIPLLWLWDRIDFPDSFGVHIGANGKTGLLENWYYSYLPLEQHAMLDGMTFLYMWLPIVGLIGWLVFRKLRTTKFSLYSEAE